MEGFWRRLGKCLLKVIIFIILGVVSLITSIVADNTYIKSITATLSSYLILGAIYEVLKKTLNEESLLFNTNY